MLAKPHAASKALQMSSLHKLTLAEFVGSTYQNVRDLILANLVLNYCLMNLQKPHKIRTPTIKSNL